MCDYLQKEKLMLCPIQARSKRQTIYVCIYLSHYLFQTNILFGRVIRVCGGIVGSHDI